MMYPKSMRKQWWVAVVLVAGAALFFVSLKRAAQRPVSNAPAAAGVGRGDPTQPSDFLKDERSAPDPLAKPDPRIGPDPNAGPDPNSRPDPSRR